MRKDLPSKQTMKTSRNNHTSEFKPELVRRGKESHFILIKGTIHQVDLTILNIYTPNVNAPSFIEEALLEGIQDGD
jgi:hypothetical protein